MKSITMFIMESCPHCVNARRWMEELLQEPKYSQLHIELIDENKQPKVAAQYDYYYVPTYFVDGKKIHEGVASKEIVRKVFDAACQN